MLKIFNNKTDLKKELYSFQSKGKLIGFVPTMGALHEGHISLIHQCNQKADYTVVSIFVNPTQFNNPEDFRLYPTQLEKDFELLGQSGCDAVYVPDAVEIYPEGTKHLPLYDLGYLETVMEGKFRPGHFQGVCQVVDRLLQLVTPDLLFLGQKDLQQCKVIERLLEITGKKEYVNLIICPTIREKDGLAMSSRNQRLSDTERKKAVAVFKGLSDFKHAYGILNFAAIKNSVCNDLEQTGIKVEYLELVNADTLEILKDWPKPGSGIKSIACIAAYLGKIRLIDNMILHTVE